MAKETMAPYAPAQVYAVPGLERSAKRRLPAQAMLSNAPPPAWAGVIDQVLIVGDLLTEAVFFHRRRLQARQTRARATIAA